MDWKSVEYLINRLTYILGFALLLMGVIGGLHSFYKWIKELLFKPKVDLFFSEMETFNKVRDAKSNQKLIFVHIAVKNRSNKIVKNAKAFLTAVMKIGEKGEKERLPEFNAKLPLNWANSGGQFIMDLLERESTRIDLFCMPVDLQCLLICTGPEPAGTMKAFTQTGKFLLKAQVISDNSPNETISLIMDWKGPGSRPTLKLCN
jgi:hypothetical protein